MSGIRIHHPTLRNSVLLVPHPGEFRKRLRIHNKGRKPKDYHIELDNEGNCIVSETVWMRLQEAGGDFIILNEIADPPTKIIGFREGTVETPAVYKQLNGVAKEFAPPGVKTFVRRVGG